MQAPENFDFPFEPYNIQHDFMRALYEVIESRKLGIFESPTGTGKSLSIICGAVRWLKDHHQRERSLLSTKIEELQTAKAEISNPDDWLSSQAEEIRINRQINALKINQNKITQYDKKIENLSSRKKNRKKWNLKTKIEPEELEAPEKKVEDEEILLELEIDDSEDPEEEEDQEKTYKSTKIFICSRTHSQLSQFVGEIIKSPFGKNLRVASLASRQNYCINPSINRLKNNSLINEKCLDMQKQSCKQSKTDSEGNTLKRQKNRNNTKCPYYKQSNIEELRDIALTEVQDIEELVNNGKEMNACPYYTSRLGAEDAEIILVPYNTILHKSTREANGIDLKDNIVIIDEAHNLLEAMSQMHSADLNYNQIEQSLLQLTCYKQRFNTRFSAPNLLSINQLIFIITKLQKFLDGCNESKTFTIESFKCSAKIDNFNMFKLLKFCKQSRIAQKVRGYTVKYPFDKEAEKKTKTGIKDFLSSIENNSNNSINLKEVKEEASVFTLSNPIFSVISFLECLTYSYNDGRIFLHYNQEKLKMKLQFLLLNVSQNFKEIVDEARSVIVAGGTMKPNAEFKQRLFINSGASPERIVDFSCNHIIPPENILPIVITEGPNKEKFLFNYENRMSMGVSVKGVLQEACKTVPGGVVVFFPSYTYEEWIWQRIKDVPLGRPIFREPQDSGSVDSVLKKYADVISKPGSKGALMFSVVGGKLSEGLNFSDDLGRCVIVVGLPYANITAPDLKEKMSYLDKTEGSGAGQKFYENLCMKAVNQSIGRAVRHQNDYATIILMDERYNRTNNKNALPDWIKRSLKVNTFKDTFDNIQKFFRERKQQTN